jgi:threonine/homoserine/homoserine lactone efflux protein
MNTPMLTVALAAVVALMLVWLGYQLARDRMRDEHAWIARQKAALEAEGGSSIRPGVSARWQTFSWCDHVHW